MGITFNSNMAEQRWDESERNETREYGTKDYIGKGQDGEDVIII